MSDKIRIAVLVSGGGTNLQALLDAQAAGILKSGEIKLVISGTREAFALTRAQNAGVEAKVISKKELGAEAAEEAMIRLLSEQKIDLIVLAGYLSILSADFTRRYDHRILSTFTPRLFRRFAAPAFTDCGYMKRRWHGV